MCAYSLTQVLIVIVQVKIYFFTPPLCNQVKTLVNTHLYDSDQLALTPTLTHLHLLNTTKEKFDPLVTTL